MGGLNKNIKSVADTASLAKRVFGTWFAYMGARELVNMSDSVQQLRDRIGILSGGAELATDIMGELEVRASRSRTTLDGLATVYARVAGSVRQLGVSTKDMLNLTETLQKTFVLSGASMGEATGVAIQLSQAFASGELRGQELRSVMEGNVYMADKLRAAFGQNIFKKAQDGSINATKVMKLLLNMGKEVDEEFQALAPTFQSTMVMATNKLQIAILKLNDTMGLSSLFYKGIEGLIDRLPILIGLITVLAVTAIPQLMKAFLGSGAFSAFMTFITGAITLLGGPLTLAIAAVIAALLYFAPTIDQITYAFKIMGAVALEVAADLIDIALIVPRVITSFAGFETANKALNALQNQLRKVADGLTDVYEAPTDGNKEVAAFLQEEKQREMALKKTAGEVDKLRVLLARINMEWKSGAISTAQYYEKLRDFEGVKAFREFKEGRKDLTAFNEATKSSNIARLNTELAMGAISMAEFRKETEALEIESLNQQLEAGAITLAKYRTEIVGITQSFSMWESFEAGATSYIESIGTISQQVAGTIQQTFAATETMFVDFITKGKVDFASFANDIVKSLLRIMYQALILKPILESVMGGGGVNYSAGGSGGGQAMRAQAKGGSYPNGLKAFAKGGVVDSPTMFKFSGNQNGLMGEAGPEAILPLKRGAGGSLGVQAATSPVIININNTAGVDVEQRETTGPGGEKMIEVLILDKVKSGISNGTFDKVMGAAYGSKRRGN